MIEPESLKANYVLWDEGCILCGHAEKSHKLVIKIIGSPNRYLYQHRIKGRKINSRRWLADYPCKCTAGFFRELVIKGKEI